MHPISPFKNPTLSWLDVPGFEIDCTLEEYSQQLDATIENTFGCPSNEIKRMKLFCKLSSRSPKDSFALRRKCEGDFPDDSLAVWTGREALELILTSQRVCEDLERFDYISPVIMLREWRPCHSHAEFRCFIHSRRLTDVTQYDSSSSVNYLTQLSSRELVQQLIERFITQRVFSALKNEDYVLDMMLEGVDDFTVADGNAFCDAVVAGQITPLVIEVNPFSRKTSGGLFSWMEDARVLLGQDESVLPFEFRYKS